MRFSERNAYKDPTPPIRDNVPEEVRKRLLEFGQRYKWDFSYRLVCRALGKPVDHTLVVPMMAYEVAMLVLQAQWYEFFDICEALFESHGDDTHHNVLCDLRLNSTPRLRTPILRGASLESTLSCMRPMPRIGL